ncbi:MAG: hypothetical protein LBI14_03575 [Treponema sp.]|jgi:hypothetical protein|nr:hypothetical protein [Treponema sp.]
MIMAAQEVPRRTRAENRLGISELEALRAKINNEEYVYEAIQRIALILSNELLDIPQGGNNYEQRRKRRR